MGVGIPPASYGPQTLIEQGCSALVDQGLNIG